MEKEILAGIVTFNPEIDRLKENINALINEEINILIVDNGSKNINAIHTVVDDFDRITIIKLSENKGIAFALKNIMSYANENGYLWVLTLDQDSVVCKGLVNEYLKFINIESVGALTCNLIDRNYPEINNSSISDIKDINECITSGCFMNVNAYNSTKGYKEELFIDFVDFDICYQLKKAGYRIIQIPYDGLLHEYGRGKKITIMGKNLYITNHPAWRKYYMIRNFCKMGRDYPEFVSDSKVNRFKFILIFKSIFFENNKKESIKEIVKGISDSKCF